MHSLPRRAAKTASCVHRPTRLRSAPCGLDLTRKDTVAQGIVYYQSVQQYRNQINHATDSAVKFQKDTGLLPLSTSAIEQTLGDVAFYLFKLKECKATAPVGIELLDSNKAF